MFHTVHHLFHPVKVLWNERIVLFWPIWIAITTFAVILVLWAVPRGKTTPPDSDLPRRSNWTHKATPWLIFLILFLACYIAVSLVWEDFTYYDNSHFTNGTLLGHNIPLQISPETGRFWPFGHQEFNLLRHITNTVIGYHSLRIVQLVLVCGILLLLAEELSVPVRVGLILLLLVTPSFLICFTGLIYAEANILFLLVCLAWFVQRFERTRSIPWALAAVISAQFLLYYKETIFLLLLGFAGTRLLLRCRKADGWEFQRLREPESRLDLCLAFLVVPFLLYYFAAMFPSFHANYENNFHISLPGVLDAYLALDLLVWIFILVTLARGIQILRRKVVPSLFWDGLAVSGLAYLAGYIVLRMASAYYLAPVDLIAILYLGRLTYLHVGGMSLGVRCFALALLVLVLFQDLSLSAFRLYEKKNVIHAKAEMGRTIKARYDSDPQSVKRLYFPFARPFFVLEFASYLNYIGVPVEELPAGSVSSKSGVQLVDKTIQKDGPCGYRDFECHPGNSPESGDLVVVFPDDFKTNEELTALRHESSEVLLSYDPRPPIPQWMHPFVNRLHIVSPAFPLAPLPDTWLKASVSVSR
jgi:hypothetical protein